MLINRLYVMKSGIIHAEDRVFIDKIPKLEWGKNTDNSFIRSTQLALNALGENYSYEYLMGISGVAFRFHYKADWCASAADPNCGFDVSKLLFNLIAYSSELHKIDDSNFNEIRTLYQRIKEEINRGYPIVAINLKENPDWGIITGYLKNRPGILCRTYYDESSDYSLAEHAPWLSFFIGKKDQKPEEREVLYKALNAALSLIETSAFEDYFSGISGLYRWINALKKLKSSKQYLDEKTRESNLNLMYNLTDCRLAAASFLISMKRLLYESTSLISVYTKEADLLRSSINNNLPKFNADTKEWTTDVIGTQIEILSQILAMEEDAAGLIRTELQCHQ